MLKAKVHAASVMDFEGIKTLLRQADVEFPASNNCGWKRLQRRGQRQRLGGEGFGVERGARRASEKACSKRGPEAVGRAVAQRRCEGRLGEAHAPKGFQVLPRRWVVERTFSGWTRAEGEQGL